MSWLNKILGEFHVESNTKQTTIVVKSGAAVVLRKHSGAKLSRQDGKALGTKNTFSFSDFTNHNHPHDTHSIDV